MLVNKVQIFAAPGDLDITFNTAGVRPGTKSNTINNISINNVNIDNEALGVAIQADGKIVAAGFADVRGKYQFAVARFNTDGSLDKTFNNLGVQPGTKSITINNLNIRSVGNSVAIQQDGKIVVGGSTDVGSGVYQFALVRLNTDGSLDTTFNTAGAQPGTKSTAINNTNILDFANCLAIQQDGKIVSAGHTDVGAGVYQFAIARFNTDGSLDETFNQAGVRPGTNSTAINNANILDFANGVVIQQDGKIVLAGYTDTGAGVYQFAVARFDKDGVLDTTFNSAGALPGTRSSTINNININNLGYALAIQKDGKIVVAGRTSVLLDVAQFAVARFNTDGSLDATFNPTGAQPGTKSTMINNININSGIASVAIQQNGKIVAAGYTDVGAGVLQLAVARFNVDGSLDKTFSTSGVLPGTTSTIINNTNLESEAFSVAIQADGKIVAVGTTNIGLGLYQFAVARFIGDIVTNNCFTSRLIEKYGPMLANQQILDF